MPEIKIKASIQNKYSPIEDWNLLARGDFIPLKGEMCYTTIGEHLYQKIGDGNTDFTDLPWLINQGDWFENDISSPAYIKNRIGGYYLTNPEDEQIVYSTVYNSNNTPELSENNNTLFYIESIENMVNAIGNYKFYNEDKTFSYSFNSILSRHFTLDGDEVYYDGNGSKILNLLTGISKEEIKELGVTINENVDWEVAYLASVNIMYVYIPYSFDFNYSTLHLEIFGSQPEIVKIENSLLNIDHTEFVGQYTESLGEIFNDYGNNSANYMAHAEGTRASADGYYSHAEGVNTIASGPASHAEGDQAKATNTSAHAEGSGTTASGFISHAEGQNTTASGSASHAEGYETIAQGNYSHAEGSNTTASGNHSHAEGDETVASGYVSHAQGLSTEASGWYSFAGGHGSIASKDNSFAFGDAAKAEGTDSISLGKASTANVDNSIALCGGTTENNDQLVLGNRNLTVDKEGNTSIAGTFSAKGYSEVALEDLQVEITQKSYIYELDKNDISSIYPYIENIDGDSPLVIRSGRNLWPQHLGMAQDLGQGVTAEYLEDGGLKLRTPSALTEDIVYNINSTNIYYLNKSTNYLCTLYSPDISTDTQDLENYPYLKVYGDGTKTVYLNSPTVFKTSTGNQRIQLIIPQSFYRGQFTLYPMIEKDLEFSEYTKPMFNILQPGEKLNVDLINEDTLIFSNNKTHIRVPHFSYCVNGFTPSEKKIKSYIQDNNKIKAYHFKTTPTLVEDQTLIFYTLIATKNNQGEWDRKYNNITLDQIKMIDQYNANSILGDFTSGIKLKGYLKSTEYDSTLAIEDFNNTLRIIDPSCSISELCLTKALVDDVEECYIYYSVTSSSGDFDFGELLLFDEIVVELPEGIVDIYCN